MINVDNNELNFYLKKSGFKVPNKNEIYRLKKINDRYYLPKIDIVLGFDLPKSIIKWLTGLSDSVGQDIINNPILFYLKHSKEKSLFVPLISMEIETSVSKHLNGGIINMWKNSYIGILVSNNSARRHINFFKNR